MNHITDPARPLADFAFVFTQIVDWSDMDAYGHVSNIRYYNYAQSARVRYIERMGLPEDTYTIIVSTACQYKSEVKYPDTLQIGMRTTHIGNTSIAHEYVYYSQTQQKVVATGSSVVVLMNKSGGKRPVDDALKARIAQLENRTN